MAVDLSTIGSILKATREEKGITLKAVSEILCLRKSLIEAVEAGKWEALPHEVYVRSYVKEYAMFLNISDIILPELHKINDVPAPEAAQETVTEQQPSEKEQSLMSRFRRMTLAVPRKALAYPAIIVILAGFFMIDKMNSHQAPLPEAKIETTTRISAQPQTASENPGFSEKQTSPTISEGKKLMITCKERTWVSIVIDDTEKKEFMLNAEEMIILNARQSFDLLIGNAGGVNLILNGKDTEFSGERGEVKRIRLP